MNTFKIRSIKLLLTVKYTAEKAARKKGLSICLSFVQAFGLSVCPFATSFKIVYFCES